MGREHILTTVILSFQLEQFRLVPQTGFARDSEAGLRARMLIVEKLPSAAFVVAYN